MINKAVTNAESTLEEFGGVRRYTSKVIWADSMYEVQTTACDCNRMFNQIHVKKVGEVDDLAVYSSGLRGDDWCVLLTGHSKIVQAIEEGCIPNGSLEGYVDSVPIGDNVEKPAVLEIIIG